METDTLTAIRNAGVEAARPDGPPENAIVPLRQFSLFLKQRKAVVKAKEVFLDGGPCLGIQRDDTAQGIFAVIEQFNFEMLKKYVIVQP